MKLLVAASIFALISGYGFYNSYSDAVKDRDYYLEMLRKAGRTLCDHRKKEDPKYFKDKHCDCNGWQWSGDRVDVGVACIYDSAEYGVKK